MIRWKTGAAVSLSAAILLGSLTAPTTKADGPFWNRSQPQTSVEELAEDIDELEEEIQRYGSVIAKSPDIWGEARLTRHRQEFERQMAEQLDKFKPTINAEISRSDQAFLTQSLAIAAAIQGGVPGGGGNGSAGENEGTIVNVQPPEIQLDTLNSLVTPIVGAPASTSPPPANQITVSRTNPGGLLNSTFGPTPSEGDVLIELEPTVLLDQRKRFLNHLHEIRRINEGDDTADAPGYSLNLVRVPVSVLPGDKTRQGYGAEITITAENYVTEELLPTVFRELVINDLVDQLALPLTKMVDLTWDLHEEIELLEVTISRLKQDEQDIRQVHANLMMKSPEFLSDLRQMAAAPAPGLGTLSAKQSYLRDIQDNVDLGQDGALDMAAAAADKYYPTAVRAVQNEIGTATTSGTRAQERLANAALQLATVAPPTSARARRGRYAIPPTQVLAVFGSEELATVASALFRARERLECNGRLHMSDVQAFLAEELNAAYDLLSADRVETTATSEQSFRIPFRQSLSMSLANEIRDMHDVDVSRRWFFENDVHGETGSTSADNATEALAWAVLVESVLLNDHLNADIKRVSQDPNCSTCNYMPGLVFYGPDPNPEARQAFMEYVNCRWPIHVFALDPQVQEQNVADTFSLRREMQVALALAVGTGQVNAQSMTRFVRRIEMDLRTIALNRTVVGFGHGDDTFGWRFFPRFQTPPIEGNARVFWRDLLHGGPSRDDLTRTQRLEPGMRECVAIVLMPSFIRHLRFDVRSNWFELASHTLDIENKRWVHKGDIGASMEDTVEWSKMIRSMEDSTMVCMNDAHLYRHGEVERMLRRVKQLSAELPLQTMYGDVPNDNTIGGFQMFSAGVTDLAPELTGFYGSPGINPGSPTKMFLVGKNFSVHETRVIAGLKQVDFRLLSREVMEVTIPAGVRTETRRKKPCEDTANCLDCNAKGADTEEVVDIHLATPYGVTSHLHVPVDRPTGSVAPLMWSPENLPVTYLYTKTSDAVPFEVTVAAGGIRAAPPHGLNIQVPAGVLAPNKAARLIAFVSTPDHQLGASIVLTNLSLSRSGRNYIVDAANFKTLHEGIRNVVVPHLKVKYGKNPPATDTFTVVVEGAIDIGSETIVPIGNKLLIPIQIRKATP